MHRIRERWGSFFFAPFDLRWAAIMRIAFALLVLINLAVLGLDLELWFGRDGVLPIEASRAIIDPDSRSIFEFLPQRNDVLWACFGLAVLHTVGLLLGLFARIQAAGVFFWLVAFHHRHVMIFDGEDQLFRLFAFFFIFLPSGRFFSVLSWLRARRGEPAPATHGCAWAFRLFQLETTLVYVGAAVAKLAGPEWRGGIAMWYVTRLDDAFGKYPLPDALFDSLPLIRLITWGTLAFELALPIALWVPRTRRIALVAALAFHLALEYTMNLFLFHPLMIVGLIPFVATSLPPATSAVAGRRSTPLPAH